MRRRSPLALILAVLVCLVSANCTVLDSLLRGNLRWLAVGDSYSSGEGMSDAFDKPGDNRCQRSSTAYAQRAAVEMSPSLSFDPVVFLACAGATVARIDPGRLPPDELVDKDRASQLAHLEPTDMFDVISLTFGGNDIGFDRVIKTCVLLAAGSYSRGFERDGLRGLEYVNASEGFCEFDEPKFKAQVEVLKPKLRELYSTLAGHLNNGGNVYVLGYPSLFAPPGEWNELERRTVCNLVKPADAKAIAGFANYLNRAIRTTVEGMGGAFKYVDVANLYADNHANVCGSGPDWMNGLAVDGNEVRCLPRDNLKEGVKTCLAQFSPSFHPNDAGHAAIAHELAKKVMRDFGDGK